MSPALLEERFLRLTKLVSSRSVWFWVGLIFVVGFSIRAGLVAKVEPRLHRVPVGEVNLIAHSLVYNGAYSDAYGPGSGPTAHDVPVYPFLLAILIRVFGEGASGEIAQYALTIAGASLAYAFLPVLSELCMFGRLSGVLAGFAGAIMPLNLWIFVSGLCQPISAFFMVVLAILFCKTADSGFSQPWNIRIGIFAGMLCLFNSPFIAVLLACVAAALCLRRPIGWRMRRTFLTIGICAFVALVPWTVRNQIVLGAPIVTRSNFGTELDLSNRNGTSPVSAFLLRSPVWNQPVKDVPEREKLRIMGEPAYNAARFRTAIQWIRSNPGKFLRLTCQRVFFFWFPLRSSFARTLAGGLENLVGLCGMGLLLVRRRQYAWLFAGMLLGYFSVFALLATDPRYSYPLDPILLVLGGYFVTDSITKLTGLSTANILRNIAPDTLLEDTLKESEINVNR